MKLIMEGVPDWHAEDSGQALILELDPDDREEGAFLRLQSWADLSEEMPISKYSEYDMARVHPEVGPLIGKRLRVTIEVVE